MADRLVLLLSDYMTGMLQVKINSLDRTLKSILVEYLLKELTVPIWKVIILEWKNILIVCEKIMEIVWNINYQSTVSWLVEN